MERVPREKNQNSENSRSTTQGQFDRNYTQRNTAASIDNSTRLIAQRIRFQGIFGDSAQLNAPNHTQDTDIHQTPRLPHKAWDMAQQAQYRKSPMKLLLRQGVKGTNAVFSSLKSHEQHGATMQMALRTKGEAKKSILGFWNSMTKAKFPPGSWDGGTRKDKRGNEYTEYNCGFPVDNWGDDYVNNDTRNSLETWWKTTYKGWWDSAQTYDNVKYMGYDSNNKQWLFNYHLYHR